MKTALMAVSVSALLLSPALAQTSTNPNAPKPPATQAQPAAPSATTTTTTTTTTETTFVRAQSANEWLASNMIGADITGPNNESIGEVENMVFDSNGNVKAVIVGVGGFLGIGEKSVGIPFKALNFVRNDDKEIEKVTVTFTKEQLKAAPAYAFLEDQDDTGRATTGSGDPAKPAPRR